MLLTVIHSWGMAAMAVLICTRSFPFTEQKLTASSLAQEQWRSKILGLIVREPRKLGHEQPGALIPLNKQRDFFFR